MWTLIEWWAAFAFFFGGAAAIFCMACDAAEAIKRWRAKK